MVLEPSPCQSIESRYVVIASELKLEAFLPNRNRNADECLLNSLYLCIRKRRSFLHHCNQAAPIFLKRIFVYKRAVQHGFFYGQSYSSTKRKLPSNPSKVSHLLIFVENQARSNRLASFDQVSALKTPLHFGTGFNPAKPGWNNNIWANATRANTFTDGAGDAVLSTGMKFPPYPEFQFTSNRFELAFHRR